MLAKLTKKKGWRTQKNWTKWRLSLVLLISTPFTAVRCSQTSVLIMASAYRFEVIFRMEIFRRIMAVSSETIGGKWCKCLCYITEGKRAVKRLLWHTLWSATSLRPALTHLPHHIFTPCTQPPTRPHIITTCTHSPTTPHHYALHPTTNQTI